MQTILIVFMTNISNVLRNRLSLLIFFCVLTLLSGCSHERKDQFDSLSTSITEETLEIISVCNAGYAIQTSAQLNIELGKFRQSSSGFFFLGLAAKEELRGLLLLSDSVTPENIDTVYRSYIRCVEGKRSTEELISIIENRYNTVKDDLITYERYEELDIFEEHYDDYISALERNQRVLAHELLASITRSLISTSVKIEETEGARINFLFSLDGMDESKSLSQRLVDEIRNDPDSARLRRRNKSINECTESVKAITLDVEGIFNIRQSCEKRIDNQILIQRVSGKCISPLTPDRKMQCLEQLFGGE